MSGVGSTEKDTASMMGRALRGQEDSDLEPRSLPITKSLPWTRFLSVRVLENFDVHTRRREVGASGVLPGP